MKTPFFSIIIPTYNRKNFLKIAMGSVLYQTFDNFELIIVDDGSQDNTQEISNEFKDKRIFYTYQPHKGVSPARNTGIKLSHGEFICFLDSDDRFRREKLDVTFNYIKKHPEYKLFHTEEIWYNNGSYLPQKGYHKKPSGVIFSEALKLCCVSISTVAIKKQIFEKIGVFDENMPACEDYDFWLRASAQFPILLIPQYLTIKEGGHPDQQSKKYPAMDKFRIYAIKKLLENNNLKEEYYQLALKELKHKCNIYVKGAEKRGKTADIEHYKKLIDLLNIKQN